MVQLGVSETAQVHVRMEITRLLTFGVRDDGFVCGGPVDAVPQMFDIGIGDYDIGIGASLSESLAKAHSAVGQFTFFGQLYA